MATFPIDQQELAKRIESIYHHITLKVNHDVQEKYELKDEALLCHSNLISYLALREQNLAGLQQQLMEIGLADLTESHTHILYTLEKIFFHLNSSPSSQTNVPIPTPQQSREILKLRSKALFGVEHPAIMVTVDSKILNEPCQLEELLLNGMNIVRINCAHDNREIWKRIHDLLRETEKRLRLEGKYQDTACKIYMDLAGPKVRIGKLPTTPIYIQKGDNLRLYLTPANEGHPAMDNQPAGVPVTLEKAFRNVRINDSIFIDDGKIHGIVTDVTKAYIEIKIISRAAKQQRIKEGKGLNLPDSLLSLNLPALTEKDLADLPFLSQYADMIGISFVHSPLDLKKLREEIDILNRAEIGVIAKIETKDAIHNLARILLEGLSFKSFGIMLARGDLTVEVGPENLSNVQDEILSICSAAYTPVIWATGVLEKLTKKGIPSRAEITDAAHGKRANCIMLNKGAYLVDALKLLKKILNTNETKTLRLIDLTSQFGVFK